MVLKILLCAAILSSVACASTRRVFSSWGDPTKSVYITDVTQKPSRGIASQRN
ncbi:hypothetical protein [Bdellovibrio sp. BCCA]|uniref:hypothetical protein n=1 Tax=Bdellovibrio sp. BCCA TaxID=3136281 RepID=UPI0030F22305